MTQHIPEINEDEDEEDRIIGAGPVALPKLAEGDACVINVKRKTNMKFWGQFNGKECVIVSRHRDAAIVEVPSLKEMIVCRIKDLRRIPRF
jgi:hypothetical protein